MKRILLTLLVMCFFGGLNAAPTPTPTAVYSITASNALGLYTNGTYSAIFVTISASNFSYQFIDTSVPCFFTSIIKSNNSSTWCVMIVGSSSDIASARANSKFTVILPVTESVITSQFSAFIDQKNFLLNYFRYYK
jgi:hypothetical protein